MMYGLKLLLQDKKMTKITDDFGASISIYSRRVKKKKYSNLAEAIEDVEGVDVRDGVGKTGGLNISIRGMDLLIL